ncbi:hydroxyacylglutathione hydrolase [Cyanobium sp. Aljojuca 7D2]|uniref:hydroxyacylglutathione hydrolase n=1 Tax=Cyanobium sp. Aljojuca 7D2 TaxID=2823698 RepID=UPI0020CE81EA|nr:hydroxyacylglutathione hydrolase [Cyanobium sp. Aljojuca 7D2]MCP9891746.1 hydroxyacylglutathione hydrolase [Cyanobium sp. Aljojuca 7D2]
MPQLRVGLIPVLHDNYVFVVQRQGQAAVVDPAVAEPVLAALEQQGLELVAILHTHHHSDHIGGTPGLLARWPGAAVLASRDDQARIPLQTQGLVDGDRFDLLGETVEVLAVPGHTRAHIAYYLPISGHLFCGDTLFAAGCGRLFEGSPAQMQASLQRLGQLPEATRVWCAHEYTASNLRWAAATVAPGDPSAAAIQQRLAEVLAARAQGEPTIPSTVGLERATNLFLRAGSAEQLAALRSSKDHWAA